MAVDRQRRNTDWCVAEEDGSIVSWERAGIAVLMDIRRELQSLNALLRCPNFQSIPAKLAQIRANTAKPKKTADE